MKWLLVIIVYIYIKFYHFINRFSHFELQFLILLMAIVRSRINEKRQQMQFTDTAYADSYDSHSSQFISASNAQTVKVYNFCDFCLFIVIGKFVSDCLYVHSWMLSFSYQNNFVDFSVYRKVLDLQIWLLSALEILVERIMIPLIFPTHPPDPLLTHIAIALFRPVSHHQPHPHNHPLWQG